MRDEVVEVFEVEVEKERRRKKNSSPEQSDSFPCREHAISRSAFYSHEKKTSTAYSGPSQKSRCEGCRPNTSRHLTPSRSQKKDASVAFDAVVARRSPPLPRFSFPKQKKPPLTDVLDPQPVHLEEASVPARAQEPAAVPGRGEVALRGGHERLEMSGRRDGFCFRDDVVRPASLL